MRDFEHEEWLAWRDLVSALEDLGVTEKQFNQDGGPFVSAALYWHHMKSRLEDVQNARDQESTREYSRARGARQ